MKPNNRIPRYQVILIIAVALLAVLLVVALALSLLARNENQPEMDVTQPPGSDVIVPITPMYPEEVSPEQPEAATEDGTEPGNPSEPEGTVDATTPTKPEETKPQETKPVGTTPTEPTKPAGTTPTEPTKPMGTTPTEPTKPAGTTPTEPTKPAGTTPTEPTKPAEPTPTEPPKPTDQIDGGELVCKEYALFSGTFVEDGRDELVQNVAAILVKNESDRFLDLATLSYEIDGKAAAFLVTGLPAGKSAWVMEINRMQVSSNSVFTYKDCITSFKSDVMLETDMFTVTSDGNMLTATNTSGKKLSNVCVYYRVVHDDGNYFGGITYIADFGNLAPGESAEVLAGHYEKGSAEIIRYGCTDG